MSITHNTLIAIHSKLADSPKLSIQDFNAEDAVLSIAAQHEQDDKIVTDTINLEVDILDQVTARVTLYSEEADATIMVTEVAKDEDALYFTLAADTITEAIEKHLADRYAVLYAPMAQRLATAIPCVDAIDDLSIRINVTEGFWLLGFGTETGLDLISMDGNRLPLVNTSDYIGTVGEYMGDDELFEAIVSKIVETVETLVRAQQLLPLMRSDFMAAAPTQPVAQPRQAPAMNISGIDGIHGGAPGMDLVSSPINYPLPEGTHSDCPWT